MNKKVDSIIIDKEKSCREAMEIIDRTGLRLVLVVDENKKLLGIATDGDVRRAFLAGKDSNVLVGDIMVPNPTTALEGTPVTELVEIMLKKDIQEIPIVNKKGVLKDIVFFSEFKSIPLSSPDITHKEVEIINQVLTTPFLSIGPKVKEFEKKVAGYIGVKYAIAVNSGTSGLHLCVRSLDIKDGDEIITTPFSFIASANCALFERARPVFVDIEENTLNIDVSKIEEKITPRTKAVLAVHIFGQPCQMDKITEIAKKHNLYVIEDACEAIGTEYGGKKLGSFGDMAVFSFYPNKPITTSEGGMIVTKSEKLAKLCQSMRNQGRDEDDSELCHNRLGYNYRMLEMSAALGLVQMERIEEILGKRQKVAEIYNKKLGDIEGVNLPHIALDTKISWFVYVIRLDKSKFSEKDRDGIIKELKDRRINCRIYFPPIHLQPFYVEMFGYKKGDFPITEETAGLTIALPFYNNLNEVQIGYISETLKSILEKRAKPGLAHQTIHINTY